MNKKINMDINPSLIFANELERIQNPIVKEGVIEALGLAPSYFWVVPASSSGKYHPVSSLGMHGLVRHVKSVFWVGEELLGHRLYAPFTDWEKDIIRASEILHDVCKQGEEEWGTNTVTEHPLLVRNRVRPIETTLKYPEFEGWWDTICELIETHMGIWTTDRAGNQILQEPETAMQKFVHLCDFIASRKSITVDIQGREKQAFGSQAVEEVASERQVSYIKSLYNQAHAKGIVLESEVIIDSEGKVTITKTRAGELITKARKALGFE